MGSLRFVEPKKPRQAILEGDPQRLLTEVLLFVEGDATRWDDAAQHCDDFACDLSKYKKAELNLLCAIYRERATIHRELVTKMRKRISGSNSATYSLTKRSL